MKKIYSYSLSAAFIVALLSVSSVANAQDNSEVTVKDAAVATFEDLTLEPESHWAGPADNAVEVEGKWGSKNMVGTFKCGVYEFVNSYTPAWASWTGCSYSNKTATSFADYKTDQWNSAAGHGAEGSANYGVIYGSSTPNEQMEIVKVADGDAEGKLSRV